MVSTSQVPIKYPWLFFAPILIVFYLSLIPMSYTKSPLKIWTLNTAPKAEIRIEEDMVFKIMTIPIGEFTKGLPICRLLTLAFNMTTKNWAVGVHSGPKWISKNGYKTPTINTTRTYTLDKIPPKYGSTITWLSSIHYRAKWIEAPFSRIR